LRGTAKREAPPAVWQFGAFAVSRIARIVLLTALGYGIAVAVAALVTVLAMYGLALASGDGNTSSGLEFVSTGFVVGMFWTFICAFPGFIVFVIIAVRRQWRGWLIHALAGTANVVPSLLIFSGLAGSPFEFPGMVLSCFPGGFAGGAAYWLAGGVWIAAKRLQSLA
jgi:hypothetical protein